jgi:hypothetical protein
MPMEVINHINGLGTNVEIGMLDMDDEIDTDKPEDTEETPELPVKEYIESVSKDDTGSAEAPTFDNDKEAEPREHTEEYMEYHDEKNNETEISTDEPEENTTDTYVNDDIAETNKDDNFENEMDVQYGI